MTLARRTPDFAAEAYRQPAVFSYTAKPNFPYIDNPAASWQSSFRNSGQKDADKRRKT